MRLAIQHTTRYVFENPVAHGVQRLRLTPKTTHGQHIIDWVMSFEGVVEQLSYEDQNCNHVTLVNLLEGTTEVVITCTGIVQTEDKAGVMGRHSGHLPLWSFLSHTPLTKPGSRLRQLVAAVDRSQGPLASLHDLSRVVRAAVGYESGTSGVDTTAEEAVAAGRGVCQDHAHVFIAAARMMDLPARYVSGYLLMDDRVQQDATHAWAEAFVEGLGWVGFDVANEICPDHRYVRVATGRDYADAAPVTGITAGATVEDMHVVLAVEQQVAAQ